MGGDFFFFIHSKLQKQIAAPKCNIFTKPVKLSVYSTLSIWMSANWISLSCIFFLMLLVASLTNRLKMHLSALMGYAQKT